MATEAVCNAGTIIPALGTFNVKVKLTEGVVTVLRTYKHVSQLDNTILLQERKGLTAATTVRVLFPFALTVGLKQLCGVCSKIVSWTGNPAPLLVYNSVPPPTIVTRTLKVDIEELVGRRAENA